MCKRTNYNLMLRTFHLNNDVRGKLRKVPVRNSSGHHAALRAACSLMELWLHAQIDHETIALKKS